MPKYLLEVNYTLDGVKGLKTEGGSARVAAAAKKQTTYRPPGS
jgi:hypothetical protein